MKKAVRLALTLENHRALRIAAAQEGVSMAALARRIVEGYLARPRGTPASRAISGAKRGQVTQSSNRLGPLNGKR